MDFLPLMQLFRYPNPWMELPICTPAIVTVWLEILTHETPLPDHPCPVGPGRVAALCMNPEAQRIYIAEACGWHGIDNKSALGPMGMFGPLRGYAMIPDYLNDLNAAVALCDLLTKEGWRCEAGNGLDTSWECVFFRKATASTIPECRSQRGEFDPPDSEEHYGPGPTLAQAVCEAFLRTKGLWEET